uniref:RING-type E3 ubiquitin transferase BRCA1 n=1 Tax=Timema cristinae TaxID=61476 RepID=A0A7R9GWF9_TIMCR|nr:unnamed protein product [Timema cristinae]
MSYKKCDVSSSLKISPSGLEYQSRLDYVSNSDAGQGAELVSKLNHWFGHNNGSEPSCVTLSYEEFRRENISEMAKCKELQEHRQHFTMDLEACYTLFDALQLIKNTSILEMVQDPVFTRCQHMFCRVCIARILNSSTKVAHCPLCNTLLTKRNLGIFDAESKNDPQGHNIFTFKSKHLSDKCNDYQSDGINGDKEDPFIFISSQRTPRRVRYRKDGVKIIGKTRTLRPDKKAFKQKEAGSNTIPRLIADEAQNVNVDIVENCPVNINDSFDQMVQDYKSCGNAQKQDAEISEAVDESDDCLNYLFKSLQDKFPKRVIIPTSDESDGQSSLSEIHHASLTSIKENISTATQNKPLIKFWYLSSLRCDKDEKFLGCLSHLICNECSPLCQRNSHSFLCNPKETCDEECQATVAKLDVGTQSESHLTSKAKRTPIYVETEENMTLGKTKSKKVIKRARRISTSSDSGSEIRHEAPKRKLLKENIPVDNEALSPHNKNEHYFENDILSFDSDVMDEDEFMRRAVENCEISNRLSILPLDAPKNKSTNTGVSEDCNINISVTGGVTLSTQDTSKLQQLGRKNNQLLPNVSLTSSLQALLEPESRIDGESIQPHTMEFLEGSQKDDADVNDLDVCRNVEHDVHMNSDQDISSLGQESYLLNTQQQHDMEVLNLSGAFRDIKTRLNLDSRRKQCPTPSKQSSNTTSILDTPNPQQTADVPTSCWKRATTINYQPMAGNVKQSTNPLPVTICTPSIPTELCIACSGLTLLDKQKVVHFADFFKLSFSNSYESKITHLVVPKVSENLRTIKFLFGIAEKKWIVYLDWITDSIAANTLLPEEKYEAEGNDAGPRLSRQTNRPLFQQFEFYFDSLSTGTIDKAQIENLVRTCGATVVSHPNKFSFHSGKICMIVIETQDDDCTRAIDRTLQNTNTANLTVEPRASVYSLDLRKMSVTVKACPYKCVFLVFYLNNFYSSIHQDVEWLFGSDDLCHSVICKGELDAIKESSIRENILAIAVCEVTHDRMTNVGAVNAQLVATTCDWSKYYFGGRIIVKQASLQDQHPCLSRSWGCAVKSGIDQFWVQLSKLEL